MFVDRVMQVPLLTIQSIKQSKHGGSIRLMCKDVRQIKFAFDSSPKWVGGFVSMLENHVFPTKFEGTLKETKPAATATTTTTATSDNNNSNQTSVDDGGMYYAACYHRALKEKEYGECGVSGWTLFDPIQEYRRMGVIPPAGQAQGRSSLSMAQKFRLVDNTNFEISPTYPARFVVPALFTNSDLARVSAYRSQGRIPALTWRHPSGKCIMCRSSQPLTGLAGKREKSDEKLINLYRTCGVLESSSDETDVERQRFYILDARSWVAATANKIGRGKGAGKKLFCCFLVYSYDS